MFAPCLIRDFLTVMKHLAPEACWGEKGLSGSHFHIVAHHRRMPGQELKQGRDLEAGDAEAMGGVLLTGSFSLHSQRDHLSKGGLTQNEPGPSISITN